MARVMDFDGNRNRPYVSEMRNRYVAVVTIAGTEETMSFRTVRTRGLRELANEYPNLVTVTYENRPRAVFIPECAFCAARPVTGEYDCDGFSWNASCDSDQCKTGDVRRGRRNVSASNRARGFGG